MSSLLLIFTLIICNVQFQESLLTFRSSTSVPCITPFPVLKQLTTNIPDPVLERLHPFVPELEELELRADLLDEPLTYTLRAASNFRYLTSLAVEMSESDISTGYDLLTLVQNCPRLKTLRVEGHTAQGLTDDIFDEVARNSPGLETLEYKPSDPREPNNPSELTFRSIKSLGRYCQKLETLELCCNIDWENDGKDVEGVLFPRLDSFYPITSQEGQPRLRSEAPSDVLSEDEDCYLPG